MKRRRTRPGGLTLLLNRNGDPVVVDVATGARIDPAVPTLVRIPVVPVPAPRQVRSDVWNPSHSVVRYRAFKDAMRAAGVTRFEGVLRVTFFLPMPNSWSESKRERMRGTPHQQRPDIDNLLKALLDSPGRDDAHVHSIQATKVWADVGAIDVMDMEVSP